MVAGAGATRPPRPAPVWAGTGTGFQILVVMVWKPAGKASDGGATRTASSSEERRTRAAGEERGERERDGHPACRPGDPPPSIEDAVFQIGGNPLERGSRRDEDVRERVASSLANTSPLEGVDVEELRGRGRRPSRRGRAGSRARCSGRRAAPRRLRRGTAGSRTTPSPGPAPRAGAAIVGPRDDVAHRSRDDAAR